MPLLLLLGQQNGCSKGVSFHKKKVRARDRVLYDRACMVSHESKNVKMTVVVMEKCNDGNSKYEDRRGK